VTVRVGVAGAGDVVIAGLGALLTQSPDIEFDDGDPARTRPDVILYDVIGMQADGGRELWGLIGTGIPVIAVGRPLRPDLAARAVAHGAVVTLSLETSEELLVAAVLTAAEGQPIPMGISAVPVLAECSDGDRLTPRELEVLRCVAAGLSNREICAALGLGMNTIKSYIRTAYRKIEVTNRPHAVLWCLRHGFDPAKEVDART